MLHFAFLDRLEQHVAQRRTRARLIAELDGYTDRELTDMGIARANIADVIDGHIPPNQDVLRHDTA